MRPLARAGAESGALESTTGARSSRSAAREGSANLYRFDAESGAARGDHARQAGGADLTQRRWRPIASLRSSPPPPKWGTCSPSATESRGG